MAMMNFDSKEEAAVARKIVFTTLPDCGSVTEVDDGQTELVLHFAALKEAILKTPGFPQPVPVVSSPSPCSIVPIPSKGLGMIATRDVHFGEMIVAERPLLISCRGGILSLTELNTMSKEQQRQVGLVRWEKYLTCALERMESNPRTKKNADEYKKLCNSVHDGSGPLVGIFRTNCFAFPLQGDKSFNHSAVLKQLSRINHSCSPNTVKNWSPASLSMQIHAVRDIKKGEEITTWYADPLAPSSERRSYLATNYGINCQCRACREPISDHYRKGINNIRDSGIPSIARAARTPSFVRSDLLRPTLETLIVIEGAEQLEVAPAYPKVLHRLTLIYFVLGEMAEAKRYHQQWRVWQRIDAKDEANATLEACFDILYVSKAASAPP